MSNTKNSSRKQGSDETERIRKMSARLAGACLALVLFLPIIVPYLWTAETAYLSRYANLTPTALQQPLELWQRVTAALLMEIPVVFMCVGLWQARRCLLGFASGQMFTDEAVNHLRRFAVWIMRSALAAFVVSTLLSMLLSYYNAPGTRQLAIGIGSDHLLMLFFAGLVWVMAGIIREARVIAEENKTFV
jgi:hypothetical protein